MTDMSELEKQFHEEMLLLYQKSGRELGYWPSYFLRQVKQEGGLNAVKKLMRKPRSSGFTKVHEKNRLDLATESYVLNPRWRPLFSDEEAEIAQRRLTKLSEGLPGRARLTAYIQFDSETRLYVGTVPGITGAHTQGETLDEVRENLKEVLELRLEESDQAFADLPQFVAVQQIEVSI